MPKKKPASKTKPKSGTTAKKKAPSKPRSAKKKRATGKANSGTGRTPPLSVGEFKRQLLEAIGLDPEMRAALKRFGHLFPDSEETPSFVLASGLAAAFRPTDNGPTSTQHQEVHSLHTESGEVVRMVGAFLRASHDSIQRERRRPEFIGDAIATTELERLHSSVVLAATMLLPELAVQANSGLLDLNRYISTKLKHDFHVEIGGLGGGGKRGYQKYDHEVVYNMFQEQLAEGKPLMGAYEAVAEETGYHYRRVQQIVKDVGESKTKGNES